MIDLHKDEPGLIEYAVWALLYPLVELWRYLRGR